jgi:hypothetical protein
MKNKEYKTESEMNFEELAENTGVFVDWLLDSIRDRLYKCSKLKDFKGMSQLNDLYDDIISKLEEDEEE